MLLVHFKGLLWSTGRFSRIFFFLLSMNLFILIGDQVWRGPFLRSTLKRCMTMWTGALFTTCCGKWVLLSFGEVGFGDFFHHRPSLFWWTALLIVPLKPPTIWAGVTIRHHCGRSIKSSSLASQIFWAHRWFQGKHKMEIQYRILNLWMTQFYLLRRLGGNCHFQKHFETLWVGL